MNSYVIYSTSRIKLVITTTEDFLYQVYANMESGDMLAVKPVGFKVKAYKVVNNAIVRIDEAEKIEFRKANFEKFLGFTGKETIEEVDAKLDEVFLGQVDIAEWKIQNYTYLRRAFYPDILDFIDAEAKLSDPSLASTGEKQKAEYFTTVIDVKRKFPKKLI